MLAYPPVNIPLNQNMEKVEHSKRNASIRKDIAIMQN